MNERVLWTVILCTGIWFGYIKFFSPPVPVEKNIEQVQSSAGGEQKTPQTPQTVASGSAGFEAVPTKSLSQSKTNGRVNFGFSDIGGDFVSAELLEYKETVKPNSPFISMIDSRTTPFNFNWQFSNPSLQNSLNTNFKKIEKGNSLIFSGTKNNVSIEKNYSFEPGSYYLTSQIKIKAPHAANKEMGSLSLPLGAKDLKHDANDPLHSWEVVVYQNESVTRKNFEKLPNPPETMKGNTGWVAFGNRYFSSVAIADAKLNPDVVLTSGTNFSGAYLRYPIKFDSNGEFHASITMYVGPKDVKELSKTPGLKQLIDYGMFSILAYPMLEILHFFYRFVHNYGIAIILLTIFVRLLFYPLSVKSYKSMKEMQKLQPQIQALKEKYKDDKERFNREQLSLFKTHKVNPAGGCLPMLIQLPFFIALYALLANSIDLFHAPFLFWVKDLTSKDPYYVYPVLMGIAMFLQQKMTPSAGLDPAQQKVLLFMPIVFTFIMLNLPAGLTLYIFVSTLLGILQQWHMTKNKSTKPVMGLVR